jgi:hypothetical protein
VMPILAIAALNAFRIAVFAETLIVIVFIPRSSCGKEYSTQGVLVSIIFLWYY